MIAREPRAAASITRLGCGVADALASLADDDGAVVARFRRATTLRSASGRLLVVHGGDLPLTPFSTEVADVPHQWPPVGAPARVTRGHLRVGTLAFRLPARWSTPSLSTPIEMLRATEGGLPPSPTLPRKGGGGTFGPGRVRSEGASILEAVAARSTFGRWWSEAEGVGDADTFRTARLALRRLVDAVQRSDRGSAVAAGLSLLGLGPGLTPSGDDALVGFLGAWRWLSPRALDDDIRSAMLGALVDRAPSGTTPVSAEFFHHLLHDRVSEPLVQLFEALIAGPRHDIQRAADRIAAWGASSGLDTLAGVHALLLAAGAAPLRSAPGKERAAWD